MTVLDTRALGRATLARQLLLEPADIPVLDAVGHLCGLQAQEPQEPFVGLWSRLRAFDPAALSDLLTGRSVADRLGFPGSSWVVRGDVGWLARVGAAAGVGVPRV
ncbi:DNA glycosylase AlkZ-like family protein [Streptomyces milbemycinicus]|uniref:DNA glycosylase AlkZ-like family protein n=1 Tax=Streptomyces milbemycinicus TaxID=476552 RepID=A0ABW8LJT2_9ACTN